MQSLAAMLWLTTSASNITVGVVPADMLGVLLALVVSDVRLAGFEVSSFREVDVLIEVAGVSIRMR